MLMITYYTDGSCEPNPGAGGYAVIRDMKPHLLGSERESTNIRMESKALIAALTDAAGQACEIHSASFLTSFPTTMPLPMIAVRFLS